MGRHERPPYNEVIQGPKESFNKSLGDVHKNIPTLGLYWVSEWALGPGCLPLSLLS